METFAKPRLPREGYIKTGIKNDKGWPQNVDYFVCPPQVYEALGVTDKTKLKELPIYFPSDDMDLVYPVNRKMYKLSGGKSQLVCRSSVPRDQVTTLDVNTYTGEAFRLQQNGNWDKIACNPQCPHRYATTDSKGRPQPPACKAVAGPMFHIDKVASTGCFEYDIKSESVIRDAQMVLNTAKNQLGSIANIPFIMYIKEVGSASRRGFVAGFKVDPRLTAVMKPRNPILAAIERGEAPQLTAAPVAITTAEEAIGADEAKALWALTQKTGRSKDELLSDVERYFGKQSPRHLTLQEYNQLFKQYEDELELSEEIDDSDAIPS